MSSPRGRASESKKGATSELPAVGLSDEAERASNLLNAAYKVLEARLGIGLEEACPKCEESRDRPGEDEVKAAKEIGAFVAGRLKELARRPTPLRDPRSESGFAGS